MLRLSTNISRRTSIRLECELWVCPIPSISTVSQRLQMLWLVSDTYESSMVTSDVTVAEKLKKEGREEMAHLSKAEEVEDSEGNVYSRAVYEQLKKQGVL